MLHLLLMSVGLISLIGCDPGSNGDYYDAHRAAVAVGIGTADGIVLNIDRGLGFEGCRIQRRGWPSVWPTSRET